MKKLQSAVFIMTLLFAAPAFAYLGLSCNPENKPTYEGVDCSQCHGPGADWDSLCEAFNPANALKRDFRYGYVITVDEKKCIGCKQCLSACPFPPHKPVWNFIEGHSQKCDLCAESTYWKTKTGLRGKKACVEICPVNAITFTTEIPVQTGDRGYNVDLRGDEWEKIGFPKD